MKFGILNKHHTNQTTAYKTIKVSRAHTHRKTNQSRTEDTDFFFGRDMLPGLQTEEAEKKNSSPSPTYCYIHFTFPNTMSPSLVSCRATRAPIFPHQGIYLARLFDVFCSLRYGVFIFFSLPLETDRYLPSCSFTRVVRR